MASPSDPRTPVALVTGNTGFTGRYLTLALEAAGWRVAGLSLPGADGAAVAVDLLDRRAVSIAVEQAGADAVVHLAAISFVAHGDADAIYRTNIAGTRNLLEALASTGKPPAIVVLASSANIYGNSTDDPITEATAPSPANDYAVSKLAMEFMARLWMDRLPIAITRPFNYTGVGQADHFLVPKIVAHFRRGERFIELGNLRVWRDFSDVRMVAAAYARLLSSAPAGGTFNICSGHVHSIEEVLDMMADIAGYRIQVRVNPEFVRASDVERLSGSRQRLEGAVGALPEIPLFDTLRWMYESGAPAARPGH
jgi:nucleoside-diphosphate-sugar epimerase